MWRAPRNIFILTLVISLASAEEGDSLISIEQTMNEEFPTCGSPQTDIAIGDYLCPIMTEILVPEPKPDLSQLTLHYRTPNGTIVLNLTTAAQEISERYSQYYNPNNNLIIFVHGFAAYPSVPPFINLYTALEATGQYNILALDASSVISEDPNYFKAAAYVKYIGEALGKAVVAFIQLLGQSRKKIHLIGGSLGAHICGFAGYTISLLIGHLIKRITGLDPAGPCYSNLPDECKLNKTSAKLVDIIHTNAGLFGLNELIGHADFFPNGGFLQPGCPYPGCSHLRGLDYYIESVYEHDAFLADDCDSYEHFQEGRCSGVCVAMGHYCPKTARGIFYLQTSPTSPYGLGKKGRHYDPTRALTQDIQNEVDPGLSLR